MRLFIATTNPGKLREIRHILADLDVDLLSLRDFSAVAEPDETGLTFAANARLKALYYDDTVARPAASVQCGPIYTVAEDSGLVIDALGGAPGVHSARFLRPDASYPERFAEIYQRLESVPSSPRTARFECAVAVVLAGEVIYETSGTVEGEIASRPAGERGFGYDPIFFYPPAGRTLAEVSDDAKIAVAHRGVAFRRLAAWLSSKEM